MESTPKKTWSNKDFEVSDHRLGKGTFGEVWKVTEKKSNFVLALKVVEKALLIERNYTQAARNEAKIHQGLDHENVLRMYAYFYSKNYVFYMLEYAPNGSLFELMKREVQLEENVAASFTRQLAYALRYIHNLGVYHRDVKPENCLLSARNRLKLTDFGNASLSRQDRNFWSPESRPGSCPSHVDAYVDVKGGALLFQGDKVYTIRNRTILSSSTLDKMFPNLNVAQITAGLYNKDKELLILFNERTVWGLLWFENSQSWKVMDDYPKNLPESIPFTPYGAIRWVDDSQVLLSEDGRLAMYDEVLNEPLTTGSTRTYLKGLPEKIKGASRWTEKGAVRIFTETMVFDYEKGTQKLEGTPLKQFLVCNV